MDRILEHQNPFHYFRSDLRVLGNYIDYGFRMSDDFVGPRKIQIFALLLLLAVMLYVPAYIAADLHDITLFKSILQPVIDDP